MTAIALHPRLQLLVALVRRQGGEWTTARVARAYLAADYDAPKRHTHRHDLAALCRMGVLDRRDQPGRRFYVPSRTTTDRHTTGRTRNA
jgi:hypothetical protein